jgi:virginiamycin A acetyltransferase
VLTHIAKKISNCMAFFIVSPLIVLSKVGVHVLKSESLFQACGQMLSLLPGKTGSYLRCAFYRHTIAQFGKNGFMLFGSRITKTKTRIGDMFGFGTHATLGYAHIGNNVHITNNVNVISGRYQHDFDIDYRKEGVYTCLTIGDDVFIGNNSVVMASIGEKTIIGAGSVVVKDIPPKTIAVGNPAVPIKNRSVK